MTHPVITIYTDGSCSPNPGAGGWAALLMFSDSEPKTLQGSETESTNNRMELTAPIKALQAIAQPAVIEICTDSKYVKEGITGWINGWQKRGWQTVDGTDVKNKDLWQQLIEQIGRHDVSWRWVKGHSEDKYNILVDQLASEARGKIALSAKSYEGINVYLGVTCKHSTKTGGWAAILNYKNNYKVIGARKENVTANIMYLEAVVGSLTALKKQLPVHIFTSSGYIKDGATSWLPGWQRRDWKTRDDKPVVNKDYWQAVASLQSTFDVQYHLADKVEGPCLMQEAKEIAKEFENQEPDEKEV